MFDLEVGHSWSYKKKGQFIIIIFYIYYYFLKLLLSLMVLREACSMSRWFDEGFWGVMRTSGFTVSTAVQLQCQHIRLSSCHFKRGRQIQVLRSNNNKQQQQLQNSSKLPPSEQTTSLTKGRVFLRSILIFLVILCVFTWRRPGCAHSWATIAQTGSRPGDL